MFYRSHLPSNWGHVNGVTVASLTSHAWLSVKMPNNNAEALISGFVKAWHLYTS